MAASPLAEIDWDNLTSGGYSLVTALNLLELAFAERMNVPTLTNCASTNTSLVEVDRFPFQNNSPDYGLPTWPATWGVPINTLGGVGRLLRCYLSETKIAALLGGTTYSQLAAVFDDATMFSDLGITEYPSLEIVNAVDVKIWYDIITSLKWIYSDYDVANGGNTTTTNYDSSFMAGIVENPDTDPIVYGDLVGNVPPVSQFATDEAILFTGPTSKASATSLVTGVDYYRDQASFGGPSGPPINITATILKGYNRFDITPLVNTGHTGQPQDHRAYGAMNVLGGDVLGGSDFSDYAAAYPFNNGEVHQFPTPTRTLVSGNIYEYGVSFANPPTKPTGVRGSFTANFINAGGLSVFDLWDQEGGFIYYTP